MTTTRLIPASRLVVLIATCALLLSCDYSKEVKKSMQRVLKQDFKAYHFFATPAGNFGIGTMYLKSARTLRPSEIGDEALIAIPDTYFTQDVPAAERAAILARLFPDGALGKFEVNEKLATGVGLDLAVPGIAGALTGGATLDFKKGVEVSLQAGRAAVRKLNWIELGRARADKKLSPDVLQHLDARDVMIAMNDIVVNGYTAVVKIDASANAGLKAEFEKAEGKTATLPSGTASFSKSQNGTYRIEVAEPVVVAILFKEIPVGAQATGDSESWPSLPVAEGVAARLRQLAEARRRALNTPK